MSAMSNYVKLINNFDSLKLTTFRANIDAFIDEVNGGKADLVDALYSLTEKEMAFRQDRVNRSMVVISHFPFVKTFDDYDFSYQPRLNRDEVLDLRNLRCTSQEKVDNALSIFLIAPSYLAKAAEPSFLAPCQLP